MTKPMAQHTIDEPAGRRRQRGAALLAAMLTVTLVATLAASAMWQQWRAVEVETAERGRVQSAWILVGALDWSRLILASDGRAKQFGNLGASREIAGWQWGADLQWSARRFDDAANTKVLGGYGLWNFTASKQLARDWKLLARLDNAFDKRYETAATYATEGRSFFVTLQWTPAQ